MDFLVGRGLFNRELHRVHPGNATRLHAQGRHFALAECGKACVLVSAQQRFPVLMWCIDCMVCGETEQLPAVVIPTQPSEDLMRRVLAGLQHL
ncbi:hypothetical protein [Amycolatopsis jejuensis]|uniref:hypothetical protein n=1 Tax=Amycolatopsis jejuensis TaxID=330084 RepID=UPI0005278943|nr:hypothetical protein [Amycolatopsis jejuensis]